MIVQQVLNVINRGENLGTSLTIADQNKLNLEWRQRGKVYCVSVVVSTLGTTYSTPLIHHLLHGLLKTELFAGSLTDVFKLLQMRFQIHFNIFTQA